MDSVKKPFTIMNMFFQQKQILLCIIPMQIKIDWNIELTEKQKKYVYHSEMSICNQRFMFSDIITFEIIKGNNFFCVILCDTKQEVENIYRKLEKDSKIIEPLHATTYSSAITNLIDKFGIRWAIMTEGNDK